ncbi:MAG: hypothetical protein AAF223_18955 [Bacteroidota bacterium]
MKDTLTHSLTHWDGKHIDHLVSLYNSHISDVTFIDNIIQLYQSHEDLRRATSWLIKHHYDSGNTLSAKQIKQIVSIAHCLQHWESQLHILQLIPRFDINVKMAEHLEPFAREKMNSDKKFVKAAAYEAYLEIVKNIPELRNEYRLICEEALTHESASVKAKVRKILKRIPN